MAAVDSARGGLRVVEFGSVRRRPAAARWLQIRTEAVVREGMMLVSSHGAAYSGEEGVERTTIARRFLRFTNTNAFSVSAITRLAENVPCSSLFFYSLNGG
ncbi:glutamate-5-semialdehyde dehydrogenase [Sesbania bispinosa]|nr:glutamate-5-semialdehyde dehydrogenase [Sesbania bispinosa]